MSDGPADRPKLANPRSFWFGIATLAFGAFGIVCVHVFRKGVYQAVPGCLLYDLTGIYCIGCGGTRSLYALAMGRVGEAFSHNLIAPFLVIGVVAWAIDRIVMGVRGHGFLRWKWPWWVVVSAIVFGFVFMILRNLPFAPFNLLAP